MSEQMCKVCWGDGENIKRGPCRTCNGTGTINRTGPYRLADGTWSDGVDRSERITNRPFGDRWEVYRYEDCDETPWGVLPDDKAFPTFTEAIHYADRTARTTKNGDNK